jgi:hypothetical protein
MADFEGTSLVATVHRCSQCRLASCLRSTIVAHLQAKCTGAAIESKRVKLVCSDSPSSLHATAPVNVTGDHNNVVHNVINQNITIQVVPAGEDDEQAAIVAALFSNVAVLRDILAGSLADAPAKMFRFSKGVDGPPELRNVRVQGNHVSETRELGDGSVEVQRSTVLQYVRQSLPNLLLGLDTICEDSVPLRAPKLQRSADSALQGLRKQFQGAKGCRMDVLAAATCHTRSSSEFHSIVPSHLKGLIKDMMDGLQRQVKALAKD